MDEEVVPDVWIIVKLSGTSVSETYYRVLAGWYGGFLRGDSWRMNSGITKITVEKDHYMISGVSGSVYRCGKHNETVSSYTESILDDYISENSEQISIERVAIADILDKFKPGKQ